MRKVYLLLNRNPKKDEMEYLNMNLGNIEIVKPSVEVKNFWEDIDIGKAMTCSEFCKGISEIIEDVKLKEVNIAWIEGDSFIRRTLMQELRNLDIPVIYSIHGFEIEEKESETGGHKIKSIRFIKFVECL
jgi:hypothetical protein